MRTTCFLTVILKTAFPDGVGRTAQRLLLRTAWGYNGSKGLQLNAKEEGGTVSSLVKLSLEAGKTYLLHYMVRGGTSRVDYSGGQGGLAAFTLKNPASNDWI